MLLVVCFDLGLLAFVVCLGFVNSVASYISFVLFYLCLVEWFVLDGVVRCCCVCCGGLMWCMFADVAAYGLFVLALVCAVW